MASDRDTDRQMHLQALHDAARLERAQTPSGACCRACSDSAGPRKHGRFRPGRLSVKAADNSEPEH